MSPIRKPRRSKFGNKKTTFHGIKFDSRKERDRYLILKAMEQSGDIKGLQVHPKVVLLPGFTDNEGKKHQAITYEPDFSYRLAEGRKIFEDVKGFDKKTGKFITTIHFNIKIKMFLYLLTQDPEKPLFRIVK